MYTIKGRYTTALMTIDDFEEACVNQVNQMVSHPAFTNPIVIQPDGHMGKGSCVGFTMPLSDKVVPGTIGVDISCGVLSIKIDKLTDTIPNIDRKIKQLIPTGVNIHKECQMDNDDWDNMFEASEYIAQQFVISYNRKFGTDYRAPRYNMELFEKKIKDIQIDPVRAMNSIGTLGGGNHMYEIGQSDTGYWLTVHSGSRKFGEKICMFHQNIAKKELEHKRTVLLADQILKITKQYKGQQIADEIAKVKKELGIDYDFNISGMEYLEGRNAMNYFFDMILAQQYAKYNRAIMMRIVLNNVFKESTQLDMIESVHNYIDFNDLIIRKGAIRSYVGERSLIPLNMEDGMLIVEGKSNPEWNYSMNHGSGRLMSRSKAKEVLNLDEMKQGMSDAGVYSSSLNKGTLDEAKGAYKPTELIEQAIEPTATILERVKPILNIKDSSDQMSWKERRKQLKNK